MYIFFRCTKQYGVKSIFRSSERVINVQATGRKIHFFLEQDDVVNLIVLYDCAYALCFRMDQQMRRDELVFS